MKKILMILLLLCSSFCIAQSGYITGLATGDGDGLNVYAEEDGAVTDGTAVVNNIEIYYQCSATVTAINLTVAGQTFTGTINGMVGSVAHTLSGVALTLHTKLLLTPLSITLEHQLSFASMDLPLQYLTDSIKLRGTKYNPLGLISDS